MRGRPQGLGGREQRLEDGPLGVGQVAGMTPNPCVVALIPVRLLRLVQELAAAVDGFVRVIAGQQLRGAGLPLDGGGEIAGLRMACTRASRHSGSFQWVSSQAAVPS